MDWCQEHPERIIHRSARWAYVYLFVRTERFSWFTTQLLCTLMCFFCFYWRYVFWLWPGCGMLLCFYLFWFPWVNWCGRWQIANVLVMQDFMNRWPITPLQKGIMSEFYLKVSYRPGTILKTWGHENSCRPGTGSVDGSFNRWCLCRPLFKETFNCAC
jgi:hypothetical protein